MVTLEVKLFFKLEAIPRPNMLNKQPPANEQDTVDPMLEVIYGLLTEVEMAAQ
jgi:hypothetical protein